MDFVALKSKAQEHWTKDRLDKLMAGKKLPLSPKDAADLLYICGVMNADASISAHNVSKYLQINHMLQLLQPILDDLVSRHQQIRIADLACGNSYLALMLTWFLYTTKNIRAHVVGVDHNDKVIANSNKRAAELGFADHCRFVSMPLQDVNASQLFASADDSEPKSTRPHLVLALHACDVATDFALATAIKSEADHFAIAPCCQAELARAWSSADVPKTHPHYPLFKAPNLRRETAAQYTDLMRMLLARGRGYEVTATEFVPSEHTNKNRLLVGHRRGRYLKEADEQFAALKSAMGNHTITLETLLA